MPIAQAAHVRKNVAASLGFLISPIAAAILLVAAGAARNERPFLDETSFAWLVIFYCYTLGVSLAIGMPAYFLLRRLNKVTWWSAVITGLLCGALMVFIFDLYFLLVVSIGAVSGLVFWLIESRGR